MNEFWMNLIAEILEKLVPIACLAFGSWIVVKLRKAGAKETEIQYFEVAYDFLTKAVINTNQTWVDAIKAAEGKLTEEQQEKARQKTIEIFKQMITDNVKLAIEAAYGSIDNWIMLNLESAVGEIKMLKS